MRQLAQKLRAVSLALALAVPLAGMRGLCFMSAHLSSEGRSEHECCQTGTKLARPNCCAATTWEPAPARTAFRLPVDTPAALAWTPAAIESSMKGDVPADSPRQHEHDPPEHIVLRV